MILSKGLISKIGYKLNIKYRCKDDSIFEINI